LPKSNKLIDAEQRYQDSLDKEDDYAHYGHSAGGFARDRQRAEQQLREAGGDPKHFSPRRHH
jgi:hypothetical protein